MIRGRQLSSGENDRRAPLNPVGCTREHLEVTWEVTYIPVTFVTLGYICPVVPLAFPNLFSVLGTPSTLLTSDKHEVKA